MDNQDNISIEDIRAWQKDIVTMTFFANLKDMLDHNDKMVHSQLAQNKPDEAILYNASMDTIEEVIGLAQLIIDQLNEKED